MATKVPIEIFNIGRTAVDRAEVKRWLDFIGVSPDFALPEDEAITNPALLIAIAGKRCYKSFEPGLNPNVTKIRKDWGDYLDNILASGHGSVLEHSVYTWAIENVSRVFTGEMNRHRAGWAISEGSMRFIRYAEAVPYWEPDSIKGPDAFGPLLVSRIREMPLAQIAERLPALVVGPDEASTSDMKKHATRVLFERSFDGQRDLYACLEAIWADELAEGSKFAGKKALTSLFRRTVGMGCATGGVWTGNIRALRHVITMRAAPGAEEEILHVFSRIAKMMIEKEPYLFGDFVEEGGFWKPRYVKV